LHSLNLLHALQPVATIHYNGRCNHTRAWAFTADRAAAPEVAAGAPQNGRRGVSPAQPACKCATGGEPKSVPVRMRGRGVLEYGVLERVPLPAVPYSGTLLAHGVAAAAVPTGAYGYSRVLTGTHGVLTGTHGYSIGPRGSRLSVIYPRRRAPVLVCAAFAGAARPSRAATTAARCSA
jgi:hypothetical protein